MKRAQTLPLHALARKVAAPKIIQPRIFLRGIADKPCTTYLKPRDTKSVGAQAQQTGERFKSHMLPVYDRPEFVLHHGKGSHVWDTDGNMYLDFSAGIAVNALGHADEGLLKVLNEQAGKLIHTSNVYHNEWAPLLAEQLVNLTEQQGGCGFTAGSGKKEENKLKVFFANSGTEANEGALKIARMAGKLRWEKEVAGRDWQDGTCTKTRIVCFEGSFHGRTMGALSVTTNPKYQLPFQPLIPGIDVGKADDIPGLERLVTKDTCGVIIEPIQGEGGVNEMSEAFLRALRKRCDEVGAILIFDEIQCGLYRTGSLWAHSKLPADCQPDMVTMAKPLANGFPIGAIMLRESVASGMTAGTHGTTFGGSPLACAIGHHVVGRLSAPEFVARLAETSKYLEERLSLLPKWYPGLLQEKIRGRGLIRGIGFKDEGMAGKIVGLARERGVLLLTAGKDAVRLVPSLNVEKSEVDVAIDVLEGCLGVSNP
ncbi:hypothetical protein M413DRAFT_440898 [Hebeloma cylindrosporum]|uniref:acetylornithine transaminase n=1 Tax=Hebeloma cylindrosporum TaxID=76867 RepID=A0A0C2Y7L7_HEBCY|nr:hypothetical protein M413DRAFT_440898 [Hebeloma cylindrosporum h7]